MGDKRLHVVAAPASGKTVLGLEVARRLDGPTLVLAPTLAIRDQWMQRLEELFLPAGNSTPDWVSYDLTRPSFFTVSTYQMLHAVMRSTEHEKLPSDEVETDTEVVLQQSVVVDVEEEEEQQMAAEERDERRAYSWLNLKRTDHRNAPLPDLVSLLDQIGIKTVILDEAHHLRSSWWKSLTNLINDLDDIHLLALTATPPYDVSPAEWDRYIALCGPVDAEISVPELVKVKNLCPHQDLVVFSSPVDSEATQINKFREDIVLFVSDLMKNEIFIRFIASHPWIRFPYRHLDVVLQESDVYTSMLVFLNRVGEFIPINALSLVADDITELPSFNYEWLELLLTGIFYPREGKRPKYDPAIEDFRKRLRDIGALQRRKVVLRNPDFIGKLLKRSVSKMDSIVDIANVEFGAYGDRLRMVVLADYIRKDYLPSKGNSEPELDKLGVVPIFERLRRSDISNAKLAVLTGSVLIIPTESEVLFRNIAIDVGITGNDIELSSLPYDTRYQLVKVLSQDRHKMVRVMTDLFSSGGINILVGTKSLLGEGWDAPSINSLIISSIVGSFMLSNQMRGRAIRTEPGNPQKTANIWHLVCVEPNSATPGEDYETIVRRFRAFVGVSQAESLIENGFGRLMIGEPPFTKDEIWEINERMFNRSMKRNEMRESWNDALGEDKEIRLIEDVQFAKEHLPRKAIMKFPLFVLLIGLLQVSGIALTSYLGTNWFPLALFFTSIAIILAIPTFFALLKVIRHISPRHSLGSIAQAVLRALCATGNILTPYPDLRVAVAQGVDDSVYCHLRGANRREESIFLQALQEALNPVSNPRYLLKKQSLFSKYDIIYFAVPKVLGTKKRFATIFQNSWGKYVLGMDLIFTRNSNGHLELLKARTKSMARLKDIRAETVTRWR